MGGAVAHQHEGRALFGGSGSIGKAAVRSGVRHDGFGNRFLIGIDDGSVGTDLTQQRLSNANCFDLILVAFQRLHHFVVLRAVHQVGRLHNQFLDAVGNRTFQRLIHVVDGFAVPGLNVVDDDLGGKGPAH